MYVTANSIDTIMMTRAFRQLIFFGILSLSLFECNNLEEEKKDTPNIILIMADDMGYECLKSNGSTWYETPVLDSLGANGIRFTQSFSQPLCTPSRVKIMTGLYNYRNYEHFTYLNENQLTFGQVMQQAGYKTCIVGKWQLNGLVYQLPGYNDPNRPHLMGFDEYCLWQLTKERKEGERFANPLLEQNGIVLPRDSNAYGPDIVSNYGIDFIRRHHDQPFFLYYPMLLVHDPFVPTPDSKAWTDPARRYESDTAYFKDMVVYTDKIVGNIVSELRALGIEKNTLILFTADNGTHRSIISPTSTRNVRGAKGLTIDDGIHVPFIAYWPDQIHEGKVYDGLIGLEDFFPTLAELVGQTVESDGHSFAPLLKGAPNSEKEAVFIHYDPQWGTFVNKQRNQFARSKSHKLYQDGQFFDVERDEMEAYPLNTDSLDADVLKVYQRLMNILNEAPKWESKN